MSLKTNLDNLKHQIESLKDSEKHEFIEEIIKTISNIIKDGIDRGDLKIINTALKELRYGFKIFSPFRTIRKISIFGSARIKEYEPEYIQAKEFAKILVKAGWMVITGAASGIMKAGHEGAGRDKSFGLNIRLPFEQKANLIIRNDPKLITFKYFFTRKLLFIKESDAIALFPGGFGTHDEGFEAITLIQTGKCPPRPIVMVAPQGNDYWQDFEKFIHHYLQKYNLISPEDLSLFKITHSVEEAAKEILHFYRLYHSARFSGDQFVIRLNHPVPDEILEKLNEDYKSILVKGTIKKSKPTPQEANEPDLIDLPRLLFHFDRKHWSRLRQMINFLNDLYPED